MDWLQTRGWKRSYAVLLTCTLALTLLLGLSLTLIPLVVAELQDLTAALPVLIASSNERLAGVQRWLIYRDLPINLNQWLDQLTATLPDTLNRLSDQLWQIVLETLDSVAEVLLTLVLTFYLLLDGEKIWGGLTQQAFGGRLKPLGRSLQQNLQSYFLGQFTLAALMGTVMILVLLLLGIPFALLLGLGIGLFTLLPFGDVFGMTLVTLAIAVQNPEQGLKVAIAAVIVDQIIDQLVVPRLLGSLVGLRPVWVLAALLVGAKIAGLTGIILAVPLAGFCRSALDGFVEGSTPPNLTRQYHETERI